MLTGFTRLRAALLAGALLALHPASLHAQAIISGFVRDSLTSKPLAAAIIQLLPSATPWAAGRTARSDSIGRYRIDSVAPGTYVLGFQHPRLDSLGLDAVSRTLDVPPGIRALRADLALPSGNTFVLSLCGASTDSVGVVVGRVLDAATDAPVSQGTVVIRWAEMQLVAGAVGRRMQQASAKFGSDGRYVACKIPTGAPFLVSARAGTGMSATAATLGVTDEIELSFAPGVPFLQRNLLIQMREPVAAAAVIAAVPSETPLDSARALTAPVSAPVSRAVPRSGTARLIGRVVAADGRPIGGARVSVVDTDQTVTTDTSGAFRLLNLPAGTRAVEVIAIGFAPVRTSADLRPARDATLTVNAGPRIATLAAVAVVAPVDRSGFFKRRAQGNGFFIDGNTMEQRGAQNISQALITAPTLRPNGFDRNNPTRPQVSGRGNCRPSAFMDGQMIPDGVGGIDELLTVRRVGGIEVYANPAEAPPQFRGSGNCAVILVWTRAYVP